MRLINLAVRLGALRSQPTTASSRVFLPFGIDDPRQIEKQVPRLWLVTAVAFLTMPELITLLSNARIQGAMYRALAHFAWYRRSIWHLRYEF